MAQRAVADLAQLAQERGRGEARKPALRAVLTRGAAEIRSERLRANRDGDALLEASFDANAALLLRLRVLEAIAFDLADDATALAFACTADSLAAALRSHWMTFPRGDGAVLALAAGVTPSRAVAAERRAAARQRWNATTAIAAAEAGHFVLLAQVVAAGDTSALALPALAGWDAAHAAALRASVGPNSRLVFAADSPQRRLWLAMRALHADGAISAASLAHARMLARIAPATAENFARRRVAADSLTLALASPAARPAPIHGSRRDYYRKPGEAAPVLDAKTDARARMVAASALHALRIADADAALAARGLFIHAEPDPFEVVPEQAIAVAWSIGARDRAHVRARGAELSGRLVGVAPAACDVGPETKAVLRTAFASLEGRSVGDVLVADVTLMLDVSDCGPVTVHDRVAVQVVAPVQATLIPAGGPLLTADSKVVDVVVTSRAPYTFSGGLHVLATHDWNIAPAAAFAFTLRRPGQSARQRLVLTLPPSAAPGPYELALRIDAESAAVGTLRARLVKPLRWAIVGPFARPAGNARLAPENGVSLEARYKGANGEQVAWQAVPDDAYDAEGALDFDALLLRPGRATCACAFTVLEAAAAGSARIEVEGGERVRWNGVAPEAGHVRVERGRNLLLVRSCIGDARTPWRLSVDLVDDHGQPLAILANDLVRLLNGYSTLMTAAPQKRGGPVDRVVTLRFAGSAADVDVLGSFNAWVPLDLQRQPDGSWQRELRLSPGRYAYKLIVDGKLRSDPEAPAFEADGFGGRNSLLIVR